jgi:hypothetical protein
VASGLSTTLQSGVHGSLSQVDLQNCTQCVYVGVSEMVVRKERVKKRLDRFRLMKSEALERPQCGELGRSGGVQESDDMVAEAPATACVCL